MTRSLAACSTHCSRGILVDVFVSICTFLSLFPISNAASCHKHAGNIKSSEQQKHPVLLAEYSTKSTTAQPPAYPPTSLNLVLSAGIHAANNVWHLRHLSHLHWFVFLSAIDRFSNFRCFAVAYRLVWPQHSPAFTDSLVLSLRMPMQWLIFYLHFSASALQLTSAAWLLGGWWLLSFRRIKSLTTFLGSHQHTSTVDCLWFEWEWECVCVFIYDCV